jgi:hypothetical protein
MRWFTLPALLLLPLLWSACARTAVGPASTSSSAGGAAATLPAAAGPAAAQDWQNPEAVTPLPAEGKFDLIADNPWPGPRVRVFFFGIQG